MTNTGEVWRLGRRPALDGVRGVAVLLVLVCHVTLTQERTFAFAAFGPAGVTMFFALSGFLITALLLEEHGRVGRIDLRAFYMRRARRLLPALVALVVVVGLLAAVLGSSYASPRDLSAVLLYVGNWLPAHHDYLGALNHTWSLAIEEQFYLVWPVVLILALRSERALLVLAVLGAAASTVTRWVLWFHLGGGGDAADRIYFGSDTRADALLIGCALAVLIRARGDARPRPGLATVALSGVVVFALVAFAAGPIRYLLLPTVTAAATALVIACVVRGDYHGWLASRPLRWVGERSYGLYLWHPVMLQLAGELELPWLPTVTLGVTAAFAATVLSWRYEQRLRRPRVRVEQLVPTPA